jgi:hypothetical protein
MHFRKKKNIRGINEFKRGYQSRSNLVTDEHGDLIADSHCILNTQHNHFSQLLNVYDISDVRQTEMHTAKPLVTDPRTLRLKKYK